MIENCFNNLLNSFLFGINNSLPCRDLNSGPPSTKQIAYQCATVIQGNLYTLVIEAKGNIESASDSRTKVEMRKVDASSTDYDITIDNFFGGESS